MKQSPKPPVLFRRLIQWLCREEHAEELLGDLDERFQIHLRTGSPGRARHKYRKEALLLVRPSAIRMPGMIGQLNRNLMIASHTKTTWRHLKRNPLFSLINIVGLSISMAVGILAITFVEEMYSYDTFHRDGDRIYRVTNDRIYRNGDRGTYATTSLFLGQKLREDYGYENLTLFVNTSFGQFRPKGGDHPPLDARGLYADNQFLSLFTFPLITGDPKTALSAPHSIVITADLALKLFGTKEAVGKAIEHGENTLQVTGVLDNIPSNSHLKFDALVSLATIRNDESRRPLFEDWERMWSSYVYLKLAKNETTDQLQDQLTQMATAENTKITNGRSIYPTLEALEDIAPSVGKYNQQSTVMSKSQVSMITILALVVLVSACFNYANLSIARSLKRAREVGIRKVTGAGGGQIIYQFLFEATAMALLALVLAYFIFLSVRREFLDLNLYISRTTTLDVKPELYLYFFLFAIVIGLLAGLVPAMLVAKHGIIDSLKGLASTGGNTKARQILIGVQFVFSMGLTVLVVQSYRQYDFALNFDLGYKTENILIAPLHQNDPDLLKQEFLAIPEVQSVAISSIVPSTGSTNSDLVRRTGATDSVVCYNMLVDRDYLDLMEHTLLAGSNFQGPRDGDQLIVNETFVREMALAAPLEALGLQVDFYGGTKTIVGVVEDFHYGTIYNELEPFAFMEATESGRWWNILVEIHSDDLRSTLGKLDAAWSKVDPSREFEATFFEEEIQETYKSLQALLKLFGALSAIAVIVGLLGLLGMAVYTTESRKKELTIRKVLGAELLQILVLLSKAFLWVFGFALLVTVALSNYLVKDIVLQNAKYAVDVNVWKLAFSALPVALLAFAVIILQGLATMRSNLVSNLRDD